MPGCVSIANSRELTAELALVRATPYFLPEQLEGPLVLDDLPAVSPEYQVGDRWRSCPRRDGERDQHSAEGE